jgi:hypothetical protein
MDSIVAARPQEQRVVRWFAYDVFRLELAANQLGPHSPFGLYQRLTQPMKFGLDLLWIQHGALNFLAHQLSMPLAEPVDVGCDSCHADTNAFVILLNA